MAIFYSLIAASSALLGALLVLKFHRWAEKNSIILINFAAGVMISLAFLDLLPEGLEANPAALLYVLGGFLFMFFLQYVILFHPCHDDSCLAHADTASVAGLSLHSFIDGLIIAVGFSANAGTGVLAAFAVLFHKLPDGITISSILVHTGASAKKIFSFSLLTACFTPIGTVLGLALFKNISQGALGALLSLTAGSFLFLAASDLIPETHKCKNRFAPLTLFAGVAAIIAIERFTH
ncbi:MAG: ZIP family metal transporter [Endomicrobium sp.]|jgi:ZIP family zinc transporter/zinc and cadmium transporter|nr:ZIP family metal transporter [Endomicrobium sp.]